MLSGLHDMQPLQIELSIAKYTTATHKIIYTAEASSNLGRFDGIRYGHRTENAADWKELYKNTRQEGFEFDTKKEMLAGTFFLSVENKKEYYDKAQQVRTVIKKEVSKVFENVDILIVPVEEKYNCLANLTGRPTLTISEGYTLIGKHFDEETLINVALDIGGAK